MAEFRQEPFFFSSQSEGHDSGQRSEGVGLVAREEPAKKAKPLRAHWTVQTGDLLSVTGLRAEEPG